MKKTMIKKTLLFLLVAGIGRSAFATAATSGETSFELSCRAKAKEIAADSYRNCVTENRNAEVEKLKKEYQDRLRSLKEDYEKEIDKLGGKTSAKKHPANGGKMVAASQTAKKSTSQDSSDYMTVETRPTPRDNMQDESRMDLPEPIPIENIDKN